MEKQRLIDANALWKALDAASWYDNADRDEVALTMVDEAPTVDAVPVRHGRWEKVIPSKSAAKWSTQVSCSVCHRKGYTLYNYCPNCGARMDGDDDG